MNCAVSRLLFVALATFFPGAVLGQGWTQTPAPTKNWQALAMSADGSKLVAAVYNGGIYTSTNFGGSWNSNNAPSFSWDAVASSADGSRMAAAYIGGIYTSTNGGATWNPSMVPNYSWYSMACSADGTLLAAITPIGNSVYVSTNFGGSWHTNHFPLGIYDGSSVGLSASGNALAAGNNVGIILTSTNLGATWSATNHFSGSFKSIAVSADGATLAAVSGGGTVYTSTNRGISWSSNNVANSDFNSIAASADGTRLVTVGGISSVVYAFSTNSGTSWTTNGQAGPVWRGVASSADGNCLAAAAYGGGIWLWRTVPTPCLNITPSGSFATISWTLPSTNFALLQSPTLQDWVSVINSPTLNLMTLQEEVIVAPTNTQSFYRLATP